ncbi:MULTISPECIES: DivIVA domain-containing protein [Micromonospora]|uniref:DivIVA domain-containing protein n=1 Tax=Micromonospora TaxID=1873 RepID=UPI001B372A97|nr:MULTISPECIES: DivIVA domain-containing protein [Micromonospora]MBQ1022441.1 DivIVA domain-containing protein [Micromonospora sp. D93]WSG32539.1 DivIVA domain-containing protein [Micromonospora ureilytica]
MRTVLDRLRRALRRRPRPEQRALLAAEESHPPHSGSCRTESCRLLTIRQIRERQFRQVRRGLDPVEVHDFLHRLAGDLARARRDLVLTNEENIRIKRALRRWQVRFAPGARR